MKKRVRWTHDRRQSKANNPNNEKIQAMPDIEEMFETDLVVKFLARPSSDVLHDADSFFTTVNAISPIDQKFFELIIPIATFLTGTLSGIMLAGTKKEDQEAMLAAQKMAQDNFSETKKAMTAPPPPQKVEPVFAPATSTQPQVQQPPLVTAQVVTGFGGKPAPVQPPQPEI